eukprot:2189760-Pleurochrysis_carterae.AAC.2
MSALFGQDDAVSALANREIRRLKLLFVGHAISGSRRWLWRSDPLSTVRSRRECAESALSCSSEAADARDAERMVKGSPFLRSRSVCARLSRSAPRPVLESPPEATEAGVPCRFMHFASACLRKNLSVRSSISSLVERIVGASVCVQQVVPTAGALIEQVGGCIERCATREVRILSVRP